MNIQSNINQTISLAGLLMTQSPQVKARKKALEYQGRQEQATRGLTDIEENLKRVERGEKKYNLEELENIEARTSQYQKDIYDAKSAALNPQYKNVIDTQHIRQPELSSQLTRIREMSGKAKEALTARTLEREPSKEFIKTVMEGVYSPLTDPRKGDIR